MEIKDVTDFVHEQYEKVKAQQLDALLVAEEHVFPVTDKTIAEQIQVSSYNT